MPGVSAAPRPLSPAATPEGTRDVLPPEWAQREHLRARLSGLFSAWGYRGVEVPSLEYASAAHPQDARAFKLIDSGGEVLALRSEFTTAIGSLVARRFPQGPFPVRLQYSGRLWLRAQTSELGRLREFQQLGVELVGVETPQADAELLHLAAAALREVGLGDWLARLPEGVRTPLPTGSLSAGEAQLLAFARVMLRDPALVILDEPSSRLDPATEALLTAAITRLLSGRTAIIIAHRLDTVARADRILVLGAGQVLEDGPREALAQNPRSHYADLLRAGAGAAEVLA